MGVCNDLLESDMYSNIVKFKNNGKNDMINLIMSLPSSDLPTPASYGSLPIKNGNMFEVSKDDNKKDEVVEEINEIEYSRNIYKDIKYLYNIDDIEFADNLKEEDFEVASVKDMMLDLNVNDLSNIIEELGMPSKVIVDEYLDVSDPNYKLIQLGQYYRLQKFNNIHLLAIPLPCNWSLSIGWCLNTSTDEILTYQLTLNTGDLPHDFNDDKEKYTNLKGYIDNYIINSGGSTQFKECISKLVKNCNDITAILHKQYENELKNMPLEIRSFQVRPEDDTHFTGGLVQKKFIDFFNTDERQLVYKRRKIIDEQLVACDSSSIKLNPYISKNTSSTCIDNIDDPDLFHILDKVDDDLMPLRKPKAPVKNLYKFYEKYEAYHQKEALNIDNFLNTITSKMTQRTRDNRIRFRILKTVDNDPTKSKDYCAISENARPYLIQFENVRSSDNYEIPNVKSIYFKDEFDDFVIYKVNETKGSLKKGWYVLKNEYQGDRGENNLIHFNYYKNQEGFPIIDDTFATLRIQNGDSTVFKLINNESIDSFVENLRDIYYPIKKKVLKTRLQTCLALDNTDIYNCKIMNIDIDANYNLIVPDSLQLYLNTDKGTKMGIVKKCNLENYTKYHVKNSKYPR